MTGLLHGSGDKRGILIDEREMAPELKKAALRWTVYRFTVRYVPTKEEEELISQLPHWAQKDNTSKGAIRDAPFNAYNSEQRCWNMKTITTAEAEDIRSSSRVERTTRGDDRRQATASQGEQVDHVGVAWN